MLKNRLRIIAYFCNMRSLLFLLLALPIPTYSQINNLVANPSFEDYIYCPNSTTEIESAEPWFQPLPVSSTDYFNACCSIPDFSGIVGVPSNGFGFQNAHSGNAYAGILAYEIGSQKEYLEGQLIQSLEFSKKYCVEFYYSIPGFFSQYFFASSLSMYFSNDSVLSDINHVIPVVPQISAITINDTINWIKISGSFTAGGGEKYLLIGNFEGFLQQDGGIYTYIDDVSVYLCDDTVPKPQELKIPNVFSPNNDGVNDVFVIENLPESASVQIYNRWGALVAESSTPNGSWDGRMKGGAEASAGVYYYIVNLPDGERRKGFVQLIR
jgi:gliding motility-associated-like protein